MKKSMNLQILWDLMECVEQECRQSFIIELMDLDQEGIYPIPVSIETQKNIQILVNYYNRLHKIIEKQKLSLDDNRNDPQNINFWLQIFGVFTILIEYQFQILEIENYNADRTIGEQLIFLEMIDFLDCPNNIEEEQKNAITKAKEYEKILKQVIQNLEQ